MSSASSGSGALHQLTRLTRLVAPAFSAGSGAALYRRLAGQKMPFMYRTVAHPDGSRSLAGQHQQPIGTHSPWGRSVEGFTPCCSPSAGGGLGQVQILIKRGWDEKDSLYEARCNELVVAATLHNPVRPPATAPAQRCIVVMRLRPGHLLADIHPPHCPAAPACPHRSERAGPRVHPGAGGGVGGHAPFTRACPAESVHSH